MMYTTALEVIVRDDSDTEEVADVDQPSKDKEEVDHEIDLTEADKQLREHDTEVKELMEDILNKEENNNKEPVPLINYVTPEMARKTVEVDGKQVYKTSLTRWMNQKIPLASQRKSTDRVRRVQRVGRYSSRTHTDSTTINLSF